MISPKNEITKEFDIVLIENGGFVLTDKDRKPYFGVQFYNNCGIKDKDRRIKYVYEVFQLLIEFMYQDQPEKLHEH